MMVMVEIIRIGKVVVQVKIGFMEEESDEEVGSFVGALRLEKLSSDGMIFDSMNHDISLLVFLDACLLLIFENEIRFL